MSSDSLATLFARDPLSLTRDDIDRLIETYREARKNFKNDPKKVAKPSKEAVNLADLGLL